MRSHDILTLISARFILTAAVFIYSFSIYLSHSQYLSIEQAVWGFDSPIFDFEEVIFTFGLILLPALLLPTEIKKPSSLFVYMLFLFVYVPSAVITIGNHIESIEKYSDILLSFCAGFSIICLSSRVIFQGKGEEVLPSKLLIYLVSGSSILCCILLLSIYYPSMNLVGLSETYDQREKGEATSRFVGYVQVYYSYVFSPFLLSIGLIKKKLHIIILSLIGFLVMYMITAERTLILVPIVIFFFSKALNWRNLNYRVISYSILCASLLTILISLLYHDISFFNQLGFYYITRIIAFPGIFFSQYYDLFSQDGFTHWSHITGVSSFVDAPNAFASDDKWPLLGKIVAERVHGYESNSNASMFATDGAASFGAFGVLMLSLIFSFWLIALDILSRKWNKIFLLPAIFPLTYALTNASFFTILLSFGGLFWLLILFVYSKKWRI